VRTDLADRADRDLDAALDALAEFRAGSRRSTRSHSCEGRESWKRALEVVIA
jgi:hypothetical protein